MEAMATLMKTGWGKDNPVSRRAFTAAFIPDSTLKQQRWFDDPVIPFELGRELAGLIPNAHFVPLGGETTSCWRASLRGRSSSLKPIVSWE